jgi:hypothetical protein
LQDLPVAVDDDRLPIAIVITIAIAAPLDHHGLVTIATIALTNDFAFAVAIVAGSDGYADAGRADTHSDVLRAGGHCKANSSYRDGSHHKTLDHCLLLLDENTGYAIRRGGNGSGANSAQALVANQMIATMTATTITLHTTGVTRFELPLRGESFGAWLNSLSMNRLAKSLQR